MPTAFDYDKDDEQQRKYRREQETHVGGAKYKGFLSEMFKKPGVAFVVIFFCSLFFMLIYWLFQF